MLIMNEPAHEPDTVDAPHDALTGDPEPLFRPTGALRPLDVRRPFALWLRQTHPQTGEPEFVFLGQADRLLARPLAASAAGAGVAVRGASREAGITVTEFDPGPEVHVTVRMRRMLAEGLRALYSSLREPAESAALLDAGRFELLRRRARIFAIAPRPCAVRAAPVGGPARPGIVELYRWQLQAPRVQFSADGALVALYLSGVALYAPFAARQSDAHFGLCGALTPLGAG